MISSSIIKDLLVAPELPSGRKFIERLIRRLGARGQRIRAFSAASTFSLVVTQIARVTRVTLSYPELPISSYPSPGTSFLHKTSIETVCFV